MTGKELAQWLRDVRIKAGMSQVDAAKRLGVTRTVMSRYENGVRTPSISRLQELASLYGAELTWQMHEAEEKNGE